MATNRQSKLASVASAMAVALAVAVASSPGTGWAQQEPAGAETDAATPAPASPGESAPAVAPEAPAVPAEAEPAPAPAPEAQAQPEPIAQPAAAPGAPADAQKGESAAAEVTTAATTSPDAAVEPASAPAAEPALAAPSEPGTSTIAAPADAATAATAASPAESATESIAAPGPAAAPDTATTTAESTDSIVTSDFDADDPTRGALASMSFAGGVGSVATTSVRAANSLTAAGLHVAPRYMSRVGDVDVSALGGFVNFPATEGSVLGAQFSLQARVMPGLVAIADMGPQTSVGARGPIWSDLGATVGWSAHYRSDIYFAAEPGFGLTQAGFGLIPGFPGGSSQGLELSINSEYEWDAFRFYGTPMLAAMSNRTSGGVIAGADYDFGPFTLGYGATIVSNFNNPGSGIVTIKPLEIKHSAGIRLFLNDWAYLQANYHLAPNDTYGIMTQTLLAGVGTRLLGSFATPPVRTIVVAKPPEPAPEPEPTPEPTPVPEPGAPAPKDYDSLVGRISHSLLPGGKPGKPLVVALKKKTPKGWANAPQTTKTDANGNYVFHRLPDGEYEAVYRNEKTLGQIVGAAVSNPVKVKPWNTATADIEVAWDESKIKGRINTKTNMVEVEWPAKPGLEDVIYEVILKYSPEKPFVVGSTPSPATKAKFKVSDEVKTHKLYYTVKYWKKGGEFWGSNYYGQANYKVLEVVK